MVGRMINATNMNYGHVLSRFKIEWDTYEELKKEDCPNVPVINDKGNDHKLIKWLYTFNESLYQTYESRGTLVYVLR